MSPLLVVLLACTDASPTDSDSGVTGKDTEPVETADTGAPDTADTGDTVETADTTETEETAETADTEDTSDTAVSPEGTNSSEWFDVWIPAWALVEVESFTGWRGSSSSHSETIEARFTPTDGSDPGCGWCRTIQDVDGADQCALASYFNTNTEPVGVEVGKVVGSAAADTYSLHSMTDDGEVDYSYDYGDVGKSIAVGEAHSFEIEGGNGFGAASVVDAFVMPEEPELLTPAPSLSIIQKGDIDVTWTGAGEGLIYLRIIATTSDGWAEVDCQMVDDGAFTVPGAIRDLLPAGSGQIGLIRVAQAEVDVDGTPMIVRGVASVYGGDTVE